jgi:hypothetical protein
MTLERLSKMDMVEKARMITGYDDTIPPSTRKTGNKERTSELEIDFETKE